MRHSPTKYLEDILEACESVTQFTSNRTQQDYENDDYFRAAVERKMQIIGEAIVQLGKAAPALVEKISEHRRIVGFRNILVHAYDSLDDEIVWYLITNRIPRLRQEVQQLLQG